MQPSSPIAGDERRPIVRDDRPPGAGSDQRRLGRLGVAGLLGRDAGWRGSGRLGRDSGWRGCGRGSGRLGRDSG